MQSLRRAHRALRLRENTNIIETITKHFGTSPKSKKTGAPDNKKPAVEEKARLIPAFLKALELQEVKKPDYTPEQLADAERRAKEYSRQKMKAHREWQKDMTTKIKLRDAAAAALPPRLREEALQPDWTPFPSNRLVWTETPPIEEMEQAVTGEEEAAKKRRRKIGTKQY